MKKQYLIGHAVIEITMPDDMKSPENMRLFETNAVCIDKYIELAFAEDLNSLENEFRRENPSLKEIRRSSMRILTSAEKECRAIYIEGAPFPYAIYIEDSTKNTRVWILEEMRDLLDVDTIFCSLLGLEKVMIRKKAIVLHSAYMLKNGKAVLFSAPSETGKSTQAGLWETYRGTRQINGDRSLLIREEDGWYAYGWPICGSSEICHNEAYPIQAIVMLRQAKENEVARLGIAESMKKVMSQVTINMWNAEFQIQAMDLIQELIMEVPVFELGCDISEEAVICLEQVL